MRERVRQVSVIGKGTPDAGVEELAEEVGRLLAESGVVVVCGGLRGVMEAVARGATEAGGEAIGIIPSDDPGDANPHLTHVVASGIGYARNLAVVASGEVVIAVGGEWGTLAEIAFARDMGRPVVVLEGWSVTGAGAMKDGPGIEVAKTAAEAVELALAAAAGWRHPR
jgi:uncharacterized protein (TIGR00725 family)